MAVVSTHGTLFLVRKEHLISNKHDSPLAVTKQAYAMTSASPAHRRALSMTSNYCLWSRDLHCLLRPNAGISVTH